VHVWDDTTVVPDDWPASVVAIGVFDGVHRGHRELIRHAVDVARVDGMPCVVLTFSPSPAEVLGHGDPPPRLATLKQRLRLIETLGVDSVCVLGFNREVAALSPSQFAGSVLSDQLHAANVIVGENFRFGYKARGDVGLLSILGRDLNFDVEGMHLLRSETLSVPVSSTLIRKLVASGDVAAAARSLVRPHRVEGIVVQGDGRGTGLGIPTANLEPTPYPAFPADGVYAGRIELDPYGDKRESLCAAISVGTNPTFDGVERRVEAYAYDAEGLSLYDQHIAVDFAARIRDQEKFNTPEAMVDAVKLDVVKARALLGR